MTCDKKREPVEAYLVCEGVKAILINVIAGDDSGRREEGSLEGLRSIDHHAPHLLAQVAKVPRVKPTTKCSVTERKRGARSTNHEFVFLLSPQCIPMHVVLNYYCWFGNNFKPDQCFSPSQREHLKIDTAFPCDLHWSLRTSQFNQGKTRNNTINRTTNDSIFRRQKKSCVWTKVVARDPL